MYRNRCGVDGKLLVWVVIKMGFSGNLNKRVRGGWEISIKGVDREQR